MSEAALAGTGCSAALNALLGARTFSWRRVLTAQALSYLLHAALVLGLAWATRPPPERPGSWSEPLIRVGFVLDQPAGVPAAAGPAAARSGPSQPYAWKAAALPPKPRAVREADPERIAAARPSPPPASGAPQGASGATGELEGSLKRSSPAPGLRVAHGVSGTDAGFGDAWYIAVVRDIVYSQWTSPFSDRHTAPRRLKATVYFRIQRDGSVRDAEMERPSGHSAFDRACLRAVLNATLPPLPATFPGTTLGVHYSFQLDTEG